MKVMHMARIGIVTHAPRSTQTVYQFILRLYQFNTNGHIDAHAVVHDPCVGSPDEVVRINNAIDHHTNRQWFDVLSTSLPSFAELPDELQLDMRGIVNKITTDTAFIDSRFCYTWPAWQSVFADTNDEVFFVVPYHSPHEIAAILNHDDGLPLSVGYLVWSAYMLAAERHSRNYPRFMIDHALLQKDWSIACAPLITYINQSTPSHAHETIAAFMHTYNQLGKATSQVAHDASPIADFAARLYDAFVHNADATTFDQLGDEFVRTIITQVDRSQYNQFITAHTARMRASEAYIELLQTSHRLDVQALHDDYKAQLDELYTHLNQNAAAIHQQLTLRIHELHDFYAEKIKEVDAPEQQRTNELNSKIQKLNTMLQQRTQHIQDLKFAVDKQKNAYQEHIANISRDMTNERDYYQQTIDNLTKHVAWQEQIISEQRSQLNNAWFVMPLVHLVQRIRNALRTK